MGNRKRNRGRKGNKKNVRHEVKNLKKEERAIVNRSREMVPAALSKIVRSRPMIMGMRRRPGRGLHQPNGGERITLRGREYLGQATITTSNVVGDSIFHHVVAPQTLTGTRLQIFSNLYERWRPKKWTITYVPQTGTGTSGNLVMYYEPDPSDPVPNGQLAINRAMSSRGIDFPVYSTNTPSISARMEKQFTNLYTSDTVETRTSQAGYIEAFCNFTPAATFTAGQFVLDYEIEFFKPLLELNTQNLVLNQASFQAVTPSSTAMWGTSNTANLNNAIPVTIYSAGAGLRFQPAGKNVSYLLVWRATNVGAMTNPAIAFTTTLGGVVTTNVSTYASDATHTILVYNFTVPDTGQLQIAQAVALGQVPTGVNYFITRVNSLFTAPRMMPIDKKVDYLFQLIQQVLKKEETNQSEETPQGEPDLEQLVKKYLTAQVK